MSKTLRKQRTIRRTVTVAGFGFWSGQDVQLEFRPAPPDSGLVFIRADLAPPHRIPALAANHCDTPRRTVLSCGGASVEMVEHVLAACAGLQVDNCEIWVNQPEMPGFDGSSKPFVDALLAADIVEQPALRRQFVITHTVRVGNEKSWIAVHPRLGGLYVDYQLDYGQGPIGRQSIELEVTRDTFCSELAASRTFLTQEEAQWLRQQGRGSRVSHRDILVFDDQGPIENQLRFPDECVRHKALDVVGDLALAGCDIIGRVVAYRSGHRLNAALVETLLATGICAAADKIPA